MKSMALKSILKSSNHTKMVLIALTMIGLCAVAWWQNFANQKMHLAKLKAEQERTIKVMREAVEESRKMRMSQKIEIPEEDKDLFASEQVELAQIKLWQSLPKGKRDILLPNTSNMTTLNTPTLE
jgi:hypothetical protein